MTDRMDIDALLIGALYGELTPADEARLAAHLESHPADRTALADLTRTRAAVRDSRILAVQLDPPQSVSALLLQEAARRAPRPQRESSWFHRLTRSFMAHPALAAAATCAVVGVVAGALYVRHGAQLAGDSSVHREAPVADEAIAPASPATMQAEPPPPPTASPAVAPTTPPAAAPSRVARGDGASAGKEAAASADADAYRVRLDDLRAKQAERRTAGRTKYDDAKNEPATKPDLDKFSNADDATDGDLKKAQRPQKKAKGGIELRSPEPQPRELESKTLRAEGAGSRARDVGGSAGADDVAQAPAAGAPSPSKPTIVAKTPGKADAPRTESAPSQVVAGPSAQAPAAPPAPTGKANAQRNEGRLADQAAAPADGKLAEEKDRANDSVLGWAEKQREQVIALVKSNKCRAAATAAVEIYNRAPGYYATNVATAREVKPCVQYLNTERQREDQARAAKRANAVDAAPSQQAAPPVKK